MEASRQIGAPTDFEVSMVHIVNPAPYILVALIERLLIHYIINVLRITSGFGEQQTNKVL